MSLSVILLLIGGLVLLVLGAELLVRGASTIAAMLGIPSLLVGLTIVAYGTSSPEMAVSIQSSFAGQADVALGNVVGSNIFNILIILGISALIAPLMVASQLIRLDVPIMIGVSILAFMFGSDGTISRVDGTILFIGAIVYTLFLIYEAKKQKDQESSENQSQASVENSLKNWLINICLIAVGLVLLIQGSNWLVESSTSIAKALGVSDLVIGLTIVATGTSLPELASSVVATIRGERDIAVGNVVGSNIFNILAVLGLSSAISPEGIPVATAALNFDIPVMIAVAISCFPIFYTGKTIARWEGILFLGYYVAYSTYLILDSSRHSQLPMFNFVMISFAIPITIITLIVTTARSYQAKRKRLNS
ncbi:Na+/Ca+ antiporter, CaCA family [Planktothrix serta PCC 8927]|uniref:Na+/Ca+ antiporter, CaCA family n=1 Tax=Planktothrix serta PCC 8927 TaxID=671068 RepID=A0A7Z9BIW0_9CYAN|nr:calcium/sodium antiporter [Planktothrix serta]VXD15130.1 Na+/Ca+ antiporter, CaCA family [Planktothrix serta PCC 8927]